MVYIAECIALGRTQHYTSSSTEAHGSVCPHEKIATQDGEVSANECVRDMDHP